MFFRRRVARARIWTERGGRLWRRLKLVALEYMGEIAPICDARFDAICREPAGQELLRFGLGRPQGPDQEGAAAGRCAAA